MKTMVINSVRFKYLNFKTYNKKIFYCFIKQHIFFRFVIVRNGIMNIFSWIGYLYTRNPLCVLKHSININRSRII